VYNQGGLTWQNSAQIIGGSVGVVGNVPGLRQTASDYPRLNPLNYRVTVDGATPTMSGLGAFGVKYNAPSGQLYDVGLANDLRRSTIAGTEIHHVPQSRQAESLVGDFNIRNRVGNEPAIRLSWTEHQAVNAAQRLRTAPASARDLLADEIRILRNNTNASNTQLQQLIKLNKHLHRYDYLPLHR
jgi:hypothetical protein